MKIRAISLWEPWASLIATGAKTVETRGYHTNVRGELLICAAQTKKGIKVAEDAGLIHASAAYSGRELCVYIQDRDEMELNFGMAVAVVEFAYCVGTTTFKQWPEFCGQEPFGDYSQGRYAWVFHNIKRIKEPFEVKGKQGFFYVEMPDDVEFE